MSTLDSVFDVAVAVFMLSTTAWLWFTDRTQESHRERIADLERRLGTIDYSKPSLVVVPRVGYDE